MQAKSIFNHGQIQHKVGHTGREKGDEKLRAHMFYIYLY